MLGLLHNHRKNKIPRQEPGQERKQRPDYDFMIEVNRTSTSEGSGYIGKLTGEHLVIVSLAANGVIPSYNATASQKEKVTAGDAIVQVEKEYGDARQMATLFNYLQGTIKLYIKRKPKMKNYPTEGTSMNRRQMCNTRIGG